jgi:hypothetical protein
MLCAGLRHGVDAGGPHMRGRPVTFRVLAAIAFKAHQVFVLVKSNPLAHRALANANGFADGLPRLRQRAARVAACVADSSDARATVGSSHQLSSATGSFRFAAIASAAARSMHCWFLAVYRGDIRRPLGSWPRPSTWPSSCRMTLTRSYPRTRST